MKCPKCQHENSEDAKFCNQCTYDLKKVIASPSSVALGKRLAKHIGRRQ